MNLFDQRDIDGLIAVADVRVNQAVEQLRGAFYSRGADSAPPGMRNLESEGDVRVVTRFFSRNANREEMGKVPGDLNRTVTQHPDVQQMAYEANTEQAPEVPSA